MSSITLQAETVVAGAEERVAQTGVAQNIAVSNEGRVIVFPGGIPPKSGDDVIGAIGVGGGQVDQDQTVAEAGVAALEAAPAA